MTRKDRLAMDLGLLLVLVGAAVSLAAGLTGRADLGLMAGVAAWSSAGVSVVYAGAVAAMKRRDERIAELEAGRR